MSKTVRQIAKILGVSADDLVKEKQRIRDEIKRQKIETKKIGNKFVVSDDDATKIIASIKKKNVEDNSKKTKENNEYLQMIAKLKEENSRLKADNEEKT